MIEYGGAIFLVIGFIVIFKVFGLVDKSRRVIGISKQAMTDLRNIELSDDAKEVAMQDHTKQLFVLFFLITLGAFAAVFAPLAVIWALDRVGWASLDAVLGVALSWPFLVATTGLIVVAIVVQRSHGK